MTRCNQTLITYGYVYDAIPTCMYFRVIVIASVHPVVDQLLTKGKKLIATVTRI